MGRPVRVAHIITRLIVGGAQEMVLLAARDTAPERLEHHVIHGPQVGPEGSLLPEFEQAGIRTILCEDMLREVSPIRDMRTLRHLTALLRDGGYDIAHSHTAKSGILGREAARRARVPIIVHHIHGWSFSGFRGLKRSIYAALERRAARHTDRLLAVTLEDIDKGLRAGVGKPEQYSIVRAAVDLSRFPPASPESRARARASLSLPPDAFVIGTVGRLSEQKAPLDLVTAAGHVRATCDCRLVLVGDGPLRAQTEAALAAAGLADATLMLGLRRDIEDILPALDVFVSASLWEGLPRTFIEAMSVGIPIAATAVDGVCEIIRDGRTGLLTRPGDPQALAAAVLRLRSDPALASQLAQEAQQALPEYSSHKMAADLLAVYEDLLARQR